MYPPSQQRAEPFYRQQVITNTLNNGDNDFADTLRDDLVHHSCHRIPLVPTGQVASINMKYLVEVLFESSGQFLCLQLKDDAYGRILKLDVQVTDDEIIMDMGVNHRRMNHISNDEVCAPWDDRFHYWDME